MFMIGIKVKLHKKIDKHVTSNCKQKTQTNFYSNLQRLLIMKASKLSILATVAVLFTPVAAFAQDSQVSVQGNHNSAAAVGNGNFIYQDATQASNQTQIDGLGYGYGYGYDAPDSQVSIQDNANSAAAIGHGNTIVQDATQLNNQTQVDVGGYLPHYGY